MVGGAALVAPTLDDITVGVPIAPRRRVAVTRGDPRPVDVAASLRQVIDSTVGDDQVFVGFSGGCDSSLVLAVATDVCRRSGRPDPVPVTLHYTSEQTHEDDHQRAVIQHLGLREWVRIQADDRADLLDDEVIQQLLHDGVVCPPPALTHRHVYRALGHGVYLTGEGGDEVFGARRISWPVLALRDVKRTRSLPGPQRRAAARVALTPQWFPGGRRPPFTADEGWDWVRPERLDEIRRAYAESHPAEPLRASRWAAYHLGLPRVWLSHHNIRVLAARCGVRWEAPLLDPLFLASLAAVTAPHEYVGRRAMLKRHFATYLPTSVLERDTKAVFNHAFFGPRTREFARTWDGAGTPEGVDPVALKRQWSSPLPHGCTAMLLHHVWLATNGANAGSLSS